MTSFCKRIDLSLRRLGWETSRFTAGTQTCVTVHPSIARGVHAILLMAPHHPVVGLMDFSAEPGTGWGTRFIDELLDIIHREPHLHGLAFTDASDGAAEGRGYWRHYARTRPHVTLEQAVPPSLEARLLVRESRAPRAGARA